MSLRTCSSTTRICAMCVQWNGYQGGSYVAPKKNARNFWEYDSEEKQICFKKHFEMKAWNSCSDWQKKY